MCFIRRMKADTADPAPFENAVKDLVEQVQKAAPQVSDLISSVDGNTIQWVDFVLAGTWTLTRSSAHAWHIHDLSH